MNRKVIISAVLAGAASFKDNNPAVPYTPEEFAEEAYKAHQAGAAMEEYKVKPEVECYDMDGMDNFLLVAKQAFFSEPVNINFGWGVAGGQRFRPDAFLAMKYALPPGANFTTCGVGKDQFTCNMQSCLMKP